MSTTTFPSPSLSSSSITPRSILSPPKTTTTTTTISLPSKPSSPLSIPLKLPSVPPTPPPPDSSSCSAAADHLRLRGLIRLAATRRDFSLLSALHSSLIKSHQYYNTDSELRLFNSLISAYIKLGRLPNARKVFDEIRYPDVVSYTSLISAYAKSTRRKSKNALALFFEMLHHGVDANEYTLVAVLTSCIRDLNSRLGSQIHAVAVKKDLCSVLHLSNALLGLFAKCGLVEDALQLFDEMTKKDVSSWNALILGMVNGCRYNEAFKLFREMNVDGIRGDRFSLSTLLTAASEGFGRAEGEAVHAYALKIGLELDLSVGNGLMAFYTKAGSVEDVIGVFQSMTVRDVISWTSMLTGYMEFGMVELAMGLFNQIPERNYVTYNALLAGLCQNGQGLRALELFKEILKDGVEISDFTLTSVVNACAMLCDKRRSELIHAFVIKSGCGSSPWIEAALLDMCARCGRMECAKTIFNLWSHEQDRSIAWTSMIAAHMRNGQNDEALALVHAMWNRQGLMNMDETAVAAALGVCGALGFLEMGKQMHCLIIKTSLATDRVVGNATFSMYSKCGEMEDVVRIFNQMPHHDIVSWNALITAHLLYREGDAALAVWYDMERLTIKPNSVTLLLIFSACKYTSFDSTDFCRKLFYSMAGLYDIQPVSQHYAAFVHLLGYWCYFDEAEKLIKNIPFKPDASIWRALLDSCRLRSNMRLCRQATQHLLALEPNDPSTYILVSNLYSASGRWNCSEKVREEMQQKGLRKIPGRSWVVHKNKYHSFYARDKSHPQYKDISSALDILILECMKSGYEPDTNFVLHEVEEYQKRDFLFYHSAKIACAYGILITPLGQPVKLRKNIHLCGDCHTFLKIVSRVTGREIVLRDSSGFHNFKDGECSCGDYW